MPARPGQARPTRGRRATRATTPRSWPSSPAATARALAAIEVWNEPDQANELYFAGPHKAPRYAAVLRAAYPAIKQADPGVHGARGLAGRLQRRLPARLYAAGIKGYYDGLSVHFYNLTLASLRAIHQAQLATGDAHPAVARRVRLELLLAARADPAGTGVRDRPGSRR